MRRTRDIRFPRGSLITILDIMVGMLKGFLDMVDGFRSLVSSGEAAGFRACLGHVGVLRWRGLFQYIRRDLDRMDRLVFSRMLINTKTCLADSNPLHDHSIILSSEARQLSIAGSQTHEHISIALVHVTLLIHLFPLMISACQHSQWGPRVPSEIFLHGLAMRTRTVGCENDS